MFSFLDEVLAWIRKEPAVVIGTFYAAASVGSLIAAQHGYTVSPEVLAGVLAWLGALGVRRNVSPYQPKHSA